MTVDGARHRVCRGKSPDALTRQRVPDSHYSVQPALGQSLPVVAENEGHPEGAGQRALVIGGKAFHELAAPTVPDTDETFHVEESDQCSVVRRSRADDVRAARLDRLPWVRKILVAGAGLHRFLNVEHRIDDDFARLKAFSIVSGRTYASADADEMGDGRHSGRRVLIAEESPISFVVEAKPPAAANPTNIARGEDAFVEGARVHPAVDATRIRSRWNSWRLGAS